VLPFFFCVILPSEADKTGDEQIISGRLMQRTISEAIRAVEQLYPSALEIRVYKQKALQTL
jgi:hypothetical protein